MRKKTKLSADIKNSRFLYKKQKTKSLSFLEVLKEYQIGKLKKYQFISEMHEKYNVFFDFQKILKIRGVSSLLIEEDHITIALKKDNIKFTVDNACRSALFELLNFGAYESNEMQMIKNLLEEQDTFFDIGAHLGWYSINLAKHYKNAKFYAFEPVPNTYSLLKRNISINRLENILSFNFGLSNEQRITKFFYSETGSAVASERDIFDVQTLDRVTCELKTLDNFVETEKIRKIDFIKCDVEGSEFLVINGGEKSIQKFLPILFIEQVEDWCNKFNYTTSELTSFLFSMGYKMFEITGQNLCQLQKIDTNNIDNFNFLFLHEKKHESFINKYI